MIFITCFIAWNLYCILYSVKLLLFTLLHATFIVCFIMRNLYCMLYCVQSLLYAFLRAVSIVCFIACNLYCMLYWAQSLLYALLCAISIVCFIARNLYCMLHCLKPSLHALLRAISILCFIACNLHCVQPSLRELVGLRFRDASGVVLHKDSKWFQSWQTFKDNNQIVHSKWSAATILAFLSDLKLYSWHFTLFKRINECMLLSQKLSDISFAAIRLPTFSPKKQNRLNQ
jgi:hypothetical protein